MVRCLNGDLLIFDRNATSHVGPGDYGTVDLLRSTNNGATWIKTHFLSWTDIPGRIKLDLRNFAAGVSPKTGWVWFFFSAFDTDNFTMNSTDGLAQHTTYVMKATDNGTVWQGPGGLYANCSPFGQVKFIYPCGAPTTERMLIPLYKGNNSNARYFGWSVIAYKDNPGWSLTGVTSVDVSPHGELGVGGGEYSEAAVANLGDGYLLAMSRRDASNSLEIAHSTNNGTAWTVDGPANLFGPKPPVLVTQTDIQGGLWVLALIDYDRYIYTYGYAANLKANPITGWHAIGDLPATGITGFGDYLSPVWDPATQSWFIIGGSNAWASHIIKHSVKMEILLPGTGLLPANVHPYAMLVLIFFALAMVMSVVGFAQKSKNSGVTKNDLIELVMFLTISGVLMGILVIFLGPV